MVAGEARYGWWKERVFSTEQKKQVPENIYVFEEVQLLQSGWSALARDEAFLSAVFVLFHFYFLKKHSGKVLVVQPYGQTGPLFVLSSKQTLAILGS